MLTIKPKTRKEIYLAYLSGDMSLELPEPLTRDEVNLYNLCKNKAYGEYTTVKEVLAECQVTEALNGTQWLKIPVDVVLEIGEKYIVNLNGTEYSATAYDPSINESIGGVSSWLINDGTDLSTGENLVFMIAGGEDGDFKDIGYGGLIAVTDGSTTLTISIRQEVTEVKKISGKYVEGMGYREIIVKTLFDGTVTTNGGWNNDQYDPIDFVPIVGSEYEVVFNGVTYVCKAKQMDGEIGIGDGLMFTEEGYDETQPPFCYADGWFCAREDGEYAVKITGPVEEVRPIDGELIKGFLPVLILPRKFTIDDIYMASDELLESGGKLLQIGAEIYGQIGTEVINGITYAVIRDVLGKPCKYIPPDENGVYDMWSDGEKPAAPQSFFLTDTTNTYVYRIWIGSDGTLHADIAFTKSESK